VAVAAGRPWQEGLGIATLAGLIVAILGGWSLQVVRRGNARAVQRHATALAAGDSGVIRTLQYSSLARDTLRGLLMTVAGLALATALGHLPPPDATVALSMTIVAVGAGLAAVIGGAFRSGGARGSRLVWLAAGAAIGGLVAVFR
jgi:hypothetical protein